MLSRGKSKERASTRKVTPPSPSYMSNDQFASYLADLRNNRMSRPGGARPQPDIARRDSGRPSMTSNRSSLGAASVSETSSVVRPAKCQSPVPQSQSPVPKSRSPVPYSVGRPSVAGSISSRYSGMSTSTRGRDYYPERATSPPLKPSVVVPSATYIERGQRWMEKEEAFSLRQAMDDMSLREQEEEEDAKGKDKEMDEDEKRLHEAALTEAAELVWKHQNGIKPPEPGAPYRYKPHMRKNSYAYARTASAGYYGADIEPTGLGRNMGSRSVSGSSTSSTRSANGRVSPPTVANSATAASAGERGRSSVDKSRESSMDLDRSKAYRGLAAGPRPMAVKPPSSRRRTSLKRNISGEVERPFSGDQIWEEPEGSTPAKKTPADSSETDSSEPLKIKPKNPLNRVSFVPEAPGKAKTPEPTQQTSEQTPQSAVSRLLSRIEIHRNPPSQSRNPQYTTNTSPGPDGTSAGASREDVPRKNGVEVRGDDIREATSMKLKDRSQKLPTPSFVSNTPGRPIVSFDANWKAPDKAATDEKPDPRTRSPFFRNREARKSQGEQAAPPSQSPAVSALSSVATDLPAPPAATPRRELSTPPLPINDSGARSSTPLPGITVSESPSPSRPPRSTPSAAISSPSLPSVSVSPPSVPSVSVSAPSISVSAPSISVSAPSISVSAPSISVPVPSASIPAIVTPDDDPSDAPSVPVIVTPDATSSAKTPSARPLPTPVRGPAGQVRQAAARSRGHWSPAPAPVGSRATARCHECRLPIEGRFVALRGSNERFHPQCFSCYTCGTSLEALEISPEPEPAREARLDRIRRRAAGICFRCATCGGGFDDGQVFPREAADGLIEILCTPCRARELKA
ncbi:paxillin [Magnaporthiopsis poae ATCC 64411]|uniref:Paxillin n=1 Tax=Magnaporthiopsis poae (strain ATCC 64411 / 73-15) TaxID=644358 RepID=A0A0C4E6X6_MAGP6|nr:paxillin [Magnaporthiopsis poae ATCC 64411]